MIDSSIFHGLNGEQHQAVMTTEGPLLVVAGPGTGKTLTIVRRIAYLVHGGVRPENILAVTFTNRAAREMKERTEKLLGNRASKIFIGTFHLLGLRIIRDLAPDPDVTLYGRDEQVELLQSLMQCPAKKARQDVERISRIKNFLEDASGEISEQYNAYQEALKERHACDFDDLVRVPIELFENSTMGGPWQDRFQYIIIDEYQDINPAQYRFMKLLAGSHNNICAVGDSDQAVYSFRGADLGNFLDFEKDFTGATRVVLSQNFRSTGRILSAADGVIRHNQKRLDKELAATRDQGQRVSVVSVPDDRAEAAMIIDEIEARMGGTSHYRQLNPAVDRAAAGHSCRFSDFAVIFRTNAQAKTLEDAFSASGIPCQMIGRKSGAHEKELQETIAYLRSFLHPDETEAELPPQDCESGLITPADLFDPRADAVALMTMHMAKGLEFPVVFITGCENGLLPCTIMKDGADIEEERRLFYVGMTRAKEELFLINARKRFLYGRKLEEGPSPFVSEIPEEFKESRTVEEKIKKPKPEDRQMGLF